MSQIGIATENKYLEPLLYKNKYTKSLQWKSLHQGRIEAFVPQTSEQKWLERTPRSRLLVI